jgi:L-arabinose transport system substrate-binding protein
MKLRYAFVPLAAAVVLAAAGCGSSPSSGGGGGGPFKFALITINGQQSFFVDQAAGAKSEAAALGGSVVDENVNASSSTTISDVQAAVAQKLSGIIIAPPANTLGPRIMNLANAAHIPVLAIDNNFNDAQNKPVPLVGIDAAALGKQEGAQLASLYQASHWPASSTGYLSIELPGLQTCTLRTDAEKAAFASAVPSFPSSNVIVVPYDGTVEKALSAVGPVVTAHPGVQHWLITSCNDDGVVGAGKALISAHVPVASIIGVGLGGDLACQEWASGAAPSGMVASDYFDPHMFGQTAVKVLYDQIYHHKPMPALSAIPASVISPTSYKQVIGSGC